MIRINHPQTTQEDLSRFREVMRKCVEKDFTPEEKEWIRRRKIEMDRVSKAIIANNGGKNPILGY